MYLENKRKQAEAFIGKAKAEAQKLAIAVIIAEVLLVTGYAIGEQYNLFHVFRQSNTIEIVQARTVEKIESTEDIIKRVAREKNFDDVETLLKIAKCESNMDRYAKNSVSSARGLYQILDAHGLSADDRNNPEIATSWTIDKIRKDGTKAWNESKYCWKK